MHANEAIRSGGQLSKTVIIYTTQEDNLGKLRLITLNIGSSEIFLCV